MILTLNSPPTPSPLNDSDIEQSPNSLPPQKNKNIPEPFNLRVRCLNICYI